MLIAVGTIIVALGGTMTRFGRLEYLYLAMSLGIAVIFAGVLLTRRPRAARVDWQRSTGGTKGDGSATYRGRIIPLPSRQQVEPAGTGSNDGIRFIVENVLPFDDAQVEELCQRWSATIVEANAFSRDQAKQVWALRLALPENARPRFDSLRFNIQAELAEIYAEVWSDTASVERAERGA